MAQALKYVGLALILVLFAVFVAAFWLTRTSSGAEWLWDTAAGYVPGELAAASVDGTFAGGLDLAGVSYASEVVDVDVARLRIALDLVLFPSVVVNVRELVAEGGVVRQKETDEQDEPDEPVLEKLALPLELNVRHLAVQDLQVLDSRGDEIVRIRNAELAGQWHEAISLTRVTVATDAGSLDGRISLGLSPPHALQAFVNASYLWRLDEQTEQPLRLQLQADGNLADLRVDLQAAEPELRVAGTLYRLTGSPGWDLSIQAPYFQWPLGAPSPQVHVRQVDLQSSGVVRDYTAAAEGLVSVAGNEELQFSLAVEGDGDGLGISRLVLDGEMLRARSTGAVRWADALAIEADASVAHFDPSSLTDAWPRATPVEGALNAAWSADRVELHEVRVRVPGTGAAVEGTGIVDLDREVVDVELDWRELQWPVREPEDVGWPAYFSEFGRLKVSGRPEAWTFDGRVAFAAGELPQGIFELSGRGSDDEVQARLGDSEVLGGRMQGDVAFNWRDGGSWSARLLTSDIHLDPLMPEWPGRITSEFATEGRVEPLEFEVAIASLDGVIRGMPLSGEGGLRYTDGDFQADELRIASGESHVRANGALRGPAGLDFALEVESLALYHPEIAGALRGGGNLSLADDFPRIRLSLEAEELAWRDYGLKRLAITSERLPADEPIALAATGEALSIGTREFDRFTLQLLAGEDRQRLAFDLFPGAEHIGIELDGALADWKRPLQSSWSGQLQALRLDTGGDLQFSLEGPADLHLAADRVSFTRACLADRDDAQLCLDGDWSGGANFDLAARLSSVPVNLVRLLTDTDLEFTQTLDGSMRISNSADRAPAAEGNIEIRPGSISNPVDDWLAMETGTGRLRFTLTDGQALSGELALPFADTSVIDAELLLDDINRGQDSPMGGQLRVHLTDIGVAAELAPILDEASGQFDLQLMFGGTLASPAWSGEASLRNGTLTYAPIGLVLADIELEGSIDENNRVDLTSTFRAGEGTGEIRSSADSLRGLRSGLNLLVTGDNLRLVDLPDINLDANLDLGIGLQTDRLTVNGGVLVPRARITPVDLASGQVNESDDVVVVAGGQVEEEAPDDEDTPFAVVGTVGLQLGRDVIIDLDVAEARLSGTTAFTWNGPPMPVANGQYRIAGRFAAYGQLLEITEGSIRFPGVPASNPELRIRAEREIFGNPQIRNAGVLVTGTVRKPELEVYTIPATSEDRALTLLVTGSDFDYEQGVGAVDVGTYIAPDLYISYGIGLFERQNVISLRYDIARGFGIKATSGTRAEGVDLSYTIER